MLPDAHCGIYSRCEAIEEYSFATLALQNGVDVKTLSSMLGHYFAGFTLDTYAHVTTSMQHEAAAKVGEFLKHSV